MATTVRPELTTMPARIARLPIDDRGYPVPWFVAWVNGAPEFRAMDPAKWITAIKEKRCWVCGDYLGKWLTFVIGPMCGINCTTAEPPSHAECAEWSAVNCPFLSRPKARRREDEWTKDAHANAAGDMLTRNPGVTLLWTTRRFEVFNDGKGRPLIQIGPSDRVAWICEGRNATRAEVVESIESGLPHLRDACNLEDSELRRRDARAELERRITALEALYPPEAVEA